MDRCKNCFHLANTPADPPAYGKQNSITFFNSSPLPGIICALVPAQSRFVPVIDYTRKPAVVNFVFPGLPYIHYTGMGHYDQGCDIE